MVDPSRVHPRPQLPLLLLRAGAAHVTVLERWMYAALACKVRVLKTHFLGGFR